MTTRELIRRDLRTAQNAIEAARRYGAGEYRESCREKLWEAAQAVFDALSKLEEKK